MKEPTDILRSFCSGISREFMGAGLERQTPLQGNLGDRRFCQARAIDTKGLSSGVLNTKPSLERFKTYIRPKFDARDLCEKFKDVVWGKDVHLDRVCISALKSQKDIFEDGQKIGSRYDDIVSVPLPGVTWEPRSFEYLRIPRPPLDHREWVKRHV